MAKNDSDLFDRFGRPVCASRSPRRSAGSVRTLATRHFGQRGARSVSCARLPTSSNGGCRAPRRTRARLARPFGAPPLAPGPLSRAGRDRAPPAPTRAGVPSGRPRSASAERQDRRPRLRRRPAVLARRVDRTRPRSWRRSRTARRRRRRSRRRPSSTPGRLVPRSASWRRRAR
jgi:hypothetical protein